MKKNIIVLLLIFGVSFSALAQSSLTDLLSNIEKNNPKLISGAKALQSTIYSTKMEGNLSDPQLDYSRVFTEGGQNEITLSQSFEFPTVYRHRNKSLNYTIQKSEIEFKALRMSILSEVTELYVTVIALNTRLEVLNSRLENAKQLNNFFTKKLEKGETTILEKNKVSALYINARSEVIMARTELENIKNQLTQMNGGIDVNVNGTIYPDFSSVESSLNINDIINRSYNMQAVSLDSLITKSQLKMAKNQWIPNVSIGYKALFNKGSYNSGIVAGISIPLWQNRNNVKYAKSLKDLSTANHNEIYTSQKRELENLVRSYVSYLDISKDYAGYLVDTRNEELLMKALENGAITMTDYLVELSLLYDTIDLANNAEKSLYITKAQMTKFLTE